MVLNEISRNFLFLNSFLVELEMNNRSASRDEFQHTTEQSKHYNSQERDKKLALMFLIDHVIKCGEYFVVYCGQI